MTDDLDLHHLERRRLALACADVGFFELDLEVGTITLDRRAAELVGIGSEARSGSRPTSRASIPWIATGSRTRSRP